MIEYNQFSEGETTMNIYELAKATVETKESWYSGESVIIFEAGTRSVVVKRDSIGQLRMFITIKNNINKNAKVASVYVVVGAPHNFTLTESDYNKWVSKVKSVL